MYDSNGNYDPNGLWHTSNGGGAKFYEGNNAQYRNAHVIKIPLSILVVALALIAFFFAF
ncbi:hypothetical protein [Acidithiobacillus ferriphilus]|uniref:hypothetical protein n=1 Tax=Acidithiobacillus ferriphilus TaxID=1689834 RepID=UPI001C07648C|nr:hypothetical protein [Acidithiobacillus ferriphilus]MBU2853354.1 hypothetical protein [Acidithiobacillus ferriphilus]